VLAVYHPPSSFPEFPSQQQQQQPLPNQASQEVLPASTAAEANPQTQNALSGSQSSQVASSPADRRGGKRGSDRRSPSPYGALGLSQQPEAVLAHHVRMLKG